MGLIAQLDDELGRLFATLERSGRWADTLVIFTADHGDFLGDHWLGEKELFYEQAVRVPLIVANPDPSCDSTRGSVDARLVEAIDVLPTCLDALNRPVPSHRLEGRSLLPLLRGEAVAWRDCVFSELDYSFRLARELLGREPQECRAYMVRDERWKYIHWQGLAPQLFDLRADPNEFVDLGCDPAYEQERGRLRERLLQWLLARKLRVTASDDWVRARTNTHRKHGIHYGVW
jgi:arylsulfatase A-like enzyme